NIKKRKFYLAISLTVNLGLLGFFKYFNFFIDNFVKAFTIFGFKIDARHLNIVLPVGISFYTFQTLSYSIDVYKKNLEPTEDFFSFLAFVSFFPQLVAGPIERASNLLPQFYKKRVFDYSNGVDGLKQMLWGFFKKLVIADNCAKIVDQVFSNLPSYSGSSIFIASIFFAFQIYGDFSGYSDIAIGTAKLFGFNLMTNFLYPYFSRDIAEFWRRWHISLSTWFRDYVYIPLGGSKKSVLRNILNTLIVFLVSGFWHGASWNFILWGLLNAIYFLPLLLLKKNRKNIEIVAYDKKFPSLRESFSIAITFILVCFAWIFFRANNTSNLIICMEKIFSKSLFAYPKIMKLDGINITVIFIIIMNLFEYFSRKESYGLAFINKLSPILRYSIYVMLILCIGLFMQASKTAFIYFQF
ncbi:MAG: MBOAT family O-acyltransferase, partial [Spirochaetota bacterium]